MTGVCDSCKFDKLLVKTLRYENSPTGRYLCGPCWEKKQNAARKERSFRPSGPRRTR